jgi:signal transduction histidine kinase
MKRLDKEKAEFIRVLVHELKSPVAASRMLVELLAADPPDDPALRDLPVRIAARLDEMEQLVRDILALAKIKSGDALGEVRTLDAAALAAESCDAFRERAEAKGLELAVDLPASPVPVRFDAQGFGLVVSNLVSNAVKYTPAGRIEVTLSRDGDHARLAVADSGIGVPADDLPKLGREFYRASNARGGDVPGSGVGLAGVKALVERFGGELGLRSVEGEGSTFTVSLPLAASSGD